jgi:hypothetical protein
MKNPYPATALGGAICTYANRTCLAVALAKAEGAPQPEMTTVPHL